MVDFKDLKVGDTLLLNYTNILEQRWEVVALYPETDSIRLQYSEKGEEKGDPVTLTKSWFKQYFEPYTKLSSLNPDGSIRKATCQHTFTKYVGFTDTFDFCTKCDIKKV